MIATTINPPTDLAGYDPTANAGDCWFDADEASRAIEFFPRFCTHIKGRIAGKPYELNPWERDFVATLFGWKREDQTRRYREAFVAVPRKNNKTTLCAAISLYSLLCDNEEGAEIYCAAADRDQATLVFDPASKMVAKSSEMAKLCKVIDSQKRILFTPRNSFMRAIPADAAGSHGFNAHVAIIDELHTQPNRDLYDVLRTSMAARRQPLLVSITTAGHDKDSLCYELWSYARQIRDNCTDPYFLPVIYESDDNDDWRDPKVWKRVNPNYGLSVSEEYLQEAFERAQRTPAFENTFRNLHLNQWTESESRWISSDAWRDCACELPRLDNRECFAGLDLASTDDITALVYVFPLNGNYFVVPKLFVPEETAYNGAKKYQAQYRMWAQQGLLTTTPGSATDYEFVRQCIQQDAKRYRIKQIGFDAWQALDSYIQLEKTGLDLVKVQQTFSGLFAGVKAVEEAVLARTLRHDGNEPLRWMVDSTVIDYDSAGNRKPNKRKSQGEHGTKGKIDGVVALCMAMGLAVRHSDDNVYNRRGVLTI